MISKLILRLTSPDVTSRALVYTTSLNAFRGDLLYLFKILKSKHKMKAYQTKIIYFVSYGYKNRNVIGLFGLQIRPGSHCAREK